MTKESFRQWLRFDGATFALISIQIIFTVIWLATLGSRVTMLESRGSPQAELCLGRLGALQEKVDALLRELDAHERNTGPR